MVYGKIGKLIFIKKKKYFSTFYNLCNIALSMEYIIFEFFKLTVMKIDIQVFNVDVKSFCFYYIHEMS